MRKLAIAVALSTTVLAGPALARDGAWYVGGDFGAIIVEDQDADFTPGVGAGTTGSISIGYDPGFEGALFAGYDFGAFRLEAEVSYKNADVEELITSGVGPLPGTAGTTVNFTGASGDVSVLSGMINGMLDFGDDDGLSGFVGGGVGIARVDFNSVRAFTNTGDVLDSSDTRFAWQILAGVRQALSRNVDIHLRYKFFNVDNLEFTGFGGRAVESDFRSHSLLGGITFNFGSEPTPPAMCSDGVTMQDPGPCPVQCTEGPDAGRWVTDLSQCRPVVIECPAGTVRNEVTGQCDPVVVPCDPPAVRDPQTGQCVIRDQVGPAIVYFGWDQDDLTAEARATLDGVISNYRAGGQTQVVLAGHADRSGSATYNVDLSRRRNKNVNDYLVAGGIPQSALTSQAFGEERRAIETPDGVREPQNRRVEITYGPGSGW